MRHNWIRAFKDFKNMVREDAFAILPKTTIFIKCTGLETCSIGALQRLAIFQSI
jgi:hypothetical protein